MGATGASPGVVLGPIAILVLTLPVLRAGELVVRRVRPLRRFAIPVPVVGGLAVALAVLAARAAGWEVGFDPTLHHRAWTFWLVPEVRWLAEPAPTLSVATPLMTAAFACVGLGASGSVARRGSRDIVVFLVLATVLATVQGLVGAAVAGVAGASPLVGLLCGPISMTGGHGTSAAFGGLVEEAGVPGATGIALTAATFGLVAGGVMGGPVGAALIRRHRLRARGVHGTPLRSSDPSEDPPVTVLGALRRLWTRRRASAVHLVALLACIKVGAWISWGLEAIPVGDGNLRLPGYIGAMIAGIALRNGLDLWATRRGGRTLDPEVVSMLLFVSLDVFLVIAMMTLELASLADVAAVMLLVLAAQILVTAAFAAWITFRVMGRDYEAAVMAAGHCGFGLGATPTAIANMEALSKANGPAPRAFLVVPTVGAFLIDFTNAVVITIAVNLS